MASGGLDNGLGAIRSFPRAESERRTVYSLTQAQLFVLLLGCSGLHALLRWTVSETAGIDDVDQVLRAQIWSWGYGPQPPLYTWLTKIFLGTFGSSVLSLLMLKELLIFAIYVLVYATTRQLTGNHIGALVATALLQANPSVAWEAHRELTHTVLVSACSVATVYCFLRLAPDRWLTYLWFGICGGLGLLAKYNFAILWIALLLGALGIQEFRSVVFNRKMLVALALTLAVCAPHFAWVYHHQDLAFSSVQKLRIVQVNDWSGVARGLTKWVLAILAHVGLMLAIVGLLFRRSLAKSALRTPGEKLLWSTLGWIIVIVTVNLVWFRVSGVQERYVQPLFVWFPVALVAALREQLLPRRLTALLSLSVIAAVAILLVAPGRVLLTESLRKNEVLNTPFHKLAQDLGPGVAQADCVIAQNHTLAGNLRLCFPEKLVLDPEVGPLFSPGARKGLLVWYADRNPGPPAALLQFARAFTGKSKITDRDTFEELLKYHQQRTIRLSIASLQ